MGGFVATVTPVASVWARETGQPWQPMILVGAHDQVEAARVP
jgi:hypothetical protein